LLQVQAAQETHREALLVPERTDQILRFHFLQERLLQLVVAAVEAKTAAARAQPMVCLAPRAVAAVLVCHGRALAVRVRMPQTMTPQHSETTAAIPPLLAATTQAVAAAVLVALVETDQATAVGQSVAPAVWAKRQQLLVQPLRMQVVALVDSSRTERVDLVALVAAATEERTAFRQQLDRTVSAVAVAAAECSQAH
jgi:hypothetical protein